MYRVIGMDARRQAVAGLVLAMTVFACLRIGTYTRTIPALYPIPLGPKDLGNLGAAAMSRQFLASYAPGWTLPVAIAVGVGGAVLAFLICRLRLRR